MRMEDFAVTGPLVPAVPHLVSGSCASPRAFGLGFLQTPPRGDALALLLAFGSAITWREDLHLARSVSCLAHTMKVSRARAAPAMVRRLGHAGPANEAQLAGVGLQRRVGHAVEPTTRSRPKQQSISKAALTRRNDNATR
jgi:hypothetical protein